MTTNIQLENYCKQLKLKLNGIYYKDKLPYRHERKEGLYIINSQDEKDIKGEPNGGVHWVCLYIKGKESSYFDSYGGHPYRQVREFATPHFTYNKAQIQALNSARCGEFCVYFGYCMQHKFKKVDGLNKKMMLMIQEFDLFDQKKNDDILKEKLSELYVNI